ncbi:MAG: hypothetical protein KDD36_10520, partial [Flavobacteriales bacterium]|nr:hypothetical protein [Flavobacteriales bacterium]
MVNKSDLRLLASRLGLSMLIFTLCRLLFFAFNPGAVNVSGFSVMITLMVGLRIDASAVAMTHAPLIILSLIPWIKKEKIMHVLFVLANALGLLSNLIDVEYFKFIGKRTTIDVLDLMASGSDFWNLLPRFLLDYWYVPAGCLALVWLLNRLDKRFMVIRQQNNPDIKSWKFYIISTILTLSITVLAIRGGIQMRPIGTASVAQYVEPEM